MIEATYSVTESEYLEVQRLYLRTKQKKAFYTPYAIAFLMIVSIAFVAATIPRSNWIAIIQRPGVIFPVVLTVVLLATPLTNQRGWKKRFKLEQAKLTDVHVVLGETGWSGTIPDMSTGQVTWQAFTAALESRRTFALILSTTLYIVPKRALTVEQIEELRQMLQQRHMLPETKHRDS